MSRLTTFVLGLAVLAVVVAGGVWALQHHDELSAKFPVTSPSASGEPLSTKSASPAATGLSRFYTQKLSWTSCHGSDRCATLTVPLDYADLGGDTIKLALLMVPAANASADEGALVVNPGGPGASGVDFAASANGFFSRTIREHFDIVGFDPRGVGKSDPVDCLSDSELDAYIGSVAAPNTKDEIADYLHWDDTIGAGCVANSGDLASHISTVEAARDLDILRAALGQKQLTYYGASYGTELGTVYADLFPKKVGRFVLDGAVDPAVSPRELGLQQAAAFEQELRQYVADCVSGGNCFLGGTVDDGIAKIQQLLADVASTPLPAANGRQLQGGAAFYGVIAPLYSKANWPYLTQALKAAFQGDGSQLLSLSDWYTARTAKGYADNSMEALYAITCLDDPWSISADEVKDELPAFEKASPTFGATFAWSLTGCSGWTPRAEEAQPPVGAPGANPIVVIGTTRDPVTPLKWAQDLAADLDSGVLVTRDGDGHTAYDSGNACIIDAVDGYLVEGDVPHNGLAC